MIDFMLESKATGAGAPPVEYMELIILPRNGWPKSEVDKLSLADRRLLFRLFDLEAEYGKR